MNQLKRLWIWCKRIRHLNGFGVQSPFAYSFIHSIIYRKLSRDIRRQLKIQNRESPYVLFHPFAMRVESLFFKLAAYVKPAFILYIEPEFTGGIYGFSTGGQCPCFGFFESTLKKAEGSMQELPTQLKCACGNVDKMLKEKFRTHAFVDLAYIDLNTGNADKLCQLLLNRCRQSSLLVLGNIHDKKENKVLWTKLSIDNHTALSFDLYSVGILLFDHHYTQQQYIVNFEG